MICEAHTGYSSRGSGGMPILKNRCLKIGFGGNFNLKIANICNNS